MDWTDIQKTVSNLTLYDVKAGVRKVQNGKPRSPAPMPWITVLTLHSRGKVYTPYGRLEQPLIEQDELYRHGVEGAGGHEQ